MLKVKLSSKGILTLTLNRPDIHNAFNDELIETIIKTLNEYENHENVRLLVLTGEGRSFCAGADLNWMSSMVNYSEQENYDDSAKLYELFETLNNFPKPVIGKINGAALGGGVGLVACCDYVITHEKAKFGFTEVRLGLVPAVISPFCVAKIGESHARAWFMSGERFSASIAQSMGLVHEVVDVDDFETRFENLIGSFFPAGALASVSAKSLIKNVLRLSSNDVKDYTCSLIARKRISEEGQEGMNALLNKTKPNWIES